jgi:hypothetical protein
MGQATGNNEFPVYKRSVSALKIGNVENIPVMLDFGVNGRNRSIRDDDVIFIDFALFAIACFHVYFIFHDHFFIAENDNIRHIF